MAYILMNTNHEVLTFDDEFTSIQVLDNQFLPYMLKDFVQSTNQCTDFPKTLKDMTLLRDFLASRTLDPSRVNAKTILNVAALPQSLKTEEKLKITFACRALNMEDNFWLKKADEDLSFSDVNLRTHHLAETSYDIAILGKHIYVSRDSLVPDLSAGGMFPKYWHRADEGIELWKTDKTQGLNSSSEVESSKILSRAGANCITYRQEEKDDLVFSVCSCFTSDKYSLVKATDIMDWCSHTGQNMDKVKNQYIHDFANMVIADYILGNTDRHNDNWGFMVDNNSNEIASMAPLYDLNQALVIDKLGNSKELDNLVYEPCGITFDESVYRYKKYATLDFECDLLPKAAKERWQKLKENNPKKRKGHELKHRREKDLEL